MRDLIKYLLIGLAVLLVLGLTLLSASGPLFADPVIEQAVREATGNESERFHADQLESIESLELRGAGIKSLEGLQHLTSLKYLDLRGNNISDLEPLSALTELEVLDLRGNNISDIGPIAALTELEVLDLRDNRISDISSLAELQALRELNLRGNLIEELQALAGLSELRALNLRENKLADIGPLSALDKLEDLNLRHNEITDIEPLRQLSGLTERLYLGGNPLVSIAPILAFCRDIAELDIEIEPLMFSHGGSFYDDEIMLELWADDPEAVIYYTLDGSVPDPERNRESTFVYSEPIAIVDRSDEPNVLANIPTNRMDCDFRGYKTPGDEIAKATVVRVVAKVDGMRDGPLTKTYFIGEQFRDYTFPIISLATDADNFFADDIGIYVPGDRFRPGNGSDATGNYYGRGDDWERPAHFELYEKSGELGLAQDIGVRIHGSFSRRYPQKSLRLYSRSDYGTSRFRYQFFGDKALDNYNRLILRASGNDFGYTMFRDAALQRLIQHLDIDTQFSRPSIVFINGEYWGIHNIRDRYDVHYLETHYGADRDDFTILLFDGALSSGDSAGRAHYRAMVNFAAANDLGVARNYEYMQTQMDVDNYLLYYISQIYFANADWPDNNIRYWRYNNDEYDPAGGKLDGRWRWMIFDLDAAFGYLSSHYDHDTIEWASSQIHRRRNAEWPNRLFRALLDNEEFERQLINGLADHLNTTFSTARVSGLMEEMRKLYEPEIEEHIQRWGQPLTVDEWHENVDYFVEFAEKRPSYLRQYVIKHFAVTGTANIRVEGSVGGTVKINSVLISEETEGIEDTESWTGEYFTDIPVKISVVPEAGYEFVGWGEDIDSSAETIEITLKDDIVLRPVFERAR